MYNASRILIGFGVIIRNRGTMSAGQDVIGKLGYVESDSRRGVSVSYFLDGLSRKIILNFAEIGKLLTLGVLDHDDAKIILTNKEPSLLENEIDKASKRWTAKDVSFPHLAQIAKHFYNLGRDNTYIKAEDWLKCNVGHDEDGECNLSWSVLFSDEDEMLEDFKNNVIE